MLIIHPPLRYVLPVESNIRPLSFRPCSAGRVAHRLLGTSLVPTSLDADVKNPFFGMSGAELGSSTAHAANNKKAKLVTYRVHFFETILVSYGIESHDVILACDVFHTTTTWRL